MLIIDNLNIPVNHDMTVHPSGIAAWKLALGGMENIVKGTPQNLHNVALFQSGRGHFNIQSRLLEGVMTLSSGNSIFVAAPILCDLVESTAFGQHELRRVIGDIGRVGITMLIPPANPLVRSIGAESWNVLNNSEFDGILEDSFPTTTIHLSFTKYTDYGAQNEVVFMLESIVSIHGCGKWVADLDILRSLKCTMLNKMGE